MGLDQHLAGLDADLDEFALADYHFFRQNVRTVACNWKLIQDAFLDGYHVTRLHKDTVGAFFPDALSTSDRLGDHIRSAVARNEIAEAADCAGSELDLRHHATDDAPKAAEEERDDSRGQQGDPSKAELSIRSGPCLEGDAHARSIRL